MTQEQEELIAYFYERWEQLGGNENIVVYDLEIGAPVPAPKKK